MKQILTLRQLILPLLPQWMLAWLLGILSLFCALGLLMVAGWFVSMAGLSGLLLLGSVMFQYGLPSFLIRCFAVGRTLGRYGELVWSHKIVFDLLKKLRLQFFVEFARLDNHTRTHLGLASTWHRLVKDIDTLDEFPLKVVNVQVVFISLTVLIAIGVLIVLPWAWVIVLGLVLLLALSWLMMKKTVPMAMLETTQKQTRAVFLLNLLPNLTQLVLWGRWQDLSAQFLAYDNALMATYQKTQQTKRLVMLLAQWLLVLLVLLVLYIGVGQVAVVGVPVLLAVLFLLFGLFDGVMNLVLDPLSYGRSLHAKDSLNALLADSPQTKTPLPDGNLTWQLSDICAKQPSAVFGLVGISHTIKTGVPLVITGVSGGGKSTLLDVLAGELALSSGQSLVKSDGNEPLSSNQIDWQGQLGYLGQRIDIFNKSLKENLLLGKPSASDEELWQVLDWVGLGDWARSEQAGLETSLGEYGVGVSGGQARRIALARLLLVPKRVLLLDEPFAGLDRATWQALWQILKQRQKEGILVVVSHHTDIVDDGVEQLVIGQPSLV